jgi:glycosyltransferase involved in cell wall biosynthesis
MQMSRRKLLIITNRYPAGPNDFASPFVHDFRLALEKRRIDVRVITPYYESPRNDRRFIDEKVSQFPWSDGRLVISQLPLYSPTSYLKIFRYFRNGLRTAREAAKNHNFDAVLALWAVPSGYFANRISEEFGIPYGVWVLGSDINSWARLPFVGNLIIKVIREASVLYADGYELAMKAQTLAERECRFLPSFHKLNFGRGIFGEEQKAFISVGRIEKEKGVLDLLEAFRLFAPSHPDWELHYVGDGRAAGELRDRIGRYNLEKTVKFHGYLERRAIESLLSSSAAVIIPSRADSLPLTFGEAMQAGKPTIASDVGDLPYFIEKYKVGYSYPAGDVAALAERMSLMAKQDGDVFSLNCRKVLAELDIDNSAREVENWLYSLPNPAKENSHEYARV